MRDEQMELLIRSGGGQTSTALLTGGKLCEFYVEENDAESLVGALMLGRVERVLRDLNGAFVRIGQPQNGFLPIRESDSFQRMQPAPLMSDQELIVQVKKDAKGSKGAFLTRDIALAGQYVLLMPRNRFIGVSKRVTDESDRERARKLGEQIAENRFGLIVRHAALFAGPAEVRAEAEAMLADFKALEERAACQKAPALLRRDVGMASVLLRDYAARHAIQVTACSQPPETLPQNVSWQTVKSVELEAMWEGKRVTAQVSDALKRRVPLAGGGDLVIDEREALQTIDLNSGSVVFADGQLPLTHNLSAVCEIARQIRLRNLSGVILIDFIDMDSDEQRAKVLAAMEEAVADDRVKTVIHGFTSLGLMELTRKRTRDSLRDALTEPCRACQESGRIPRH